MHIYEKYPKEISLKHIHFQKKYQIIKIAISSDRFIIYQRQCPICSYKGAGTGRYIVHSQLLKESLSFSMQKYESCMVSVVVLY